MLLPSQRSKKVSGFDTRKKSHKVLAQQSPSATFAVFL